MKTLNKKYSSLYLALTLFASFATYAAPGGNGVVPRTNWFDSYSVNGRCYIDSNFDHGIGDKVVDTPVGPRTVRQVAEKMGTGPGRADNPIYNDVQCGNGPPNDAGDEDYDQCPGRVDMGAEGCSIIGPKWDLEALYGAGAQPASAPAEPIAPPPIPEETQAPTPTVAPAPVTQTPTTSKPEEVKIPGRCDAMGATLAAAINAYAQKCAAPRVDCDPTGNGSEYLCASYNIVGNPVVTPAPAPLTPTTSEPEEVKIPGQCDALGATLSAAINAYAQKCAAPRVDCDPTGKGSEYLCASYNIVGKPVVTSVPAVPASAAPSSVPNPTPIATPAESDAGKCEAFGANLLLARLAFAKKCSVPRVDCDPISGGYVCASYIMGNAAPGARPTAAAQPAPSQPSTPRPTAPAPTAPAPGIPTTQAGQCDAVAATLAAAQSAYAAKCSLPRKDCDPVSGGYLCASYVIGANSPQGASSQPSQPQAVPATSAPASAPTSGPIRIEAETQQGAGWVNRGSYIEFTGANTYASPTYGSLVYTVRIPAAGDWEMRWRAKAAKQTPGRTDLHNDAWAKMNGVPVSGFHDVRNFRKVFTPGNGQWYVSATAELGHHNFSKFRQRFVPGTYQFELSGRSNGYAIDYIEFVQINSVGGGQASAPSPSSASVPALEPLGGIAKYLPTFSESYASGDLVSLHWDSSMDPDDMQAMILSREMLDSLPQVDYIAVNGTKRTANTQILPTATAHMKSMYPSSYEAFRNGLDRTAQNNLYRNTVNIVATNWSLTLASGGRVHVAEGGPADFTADVIKELISRNVGVSSLKNIRVVQHSWGWNERNTSDAAMNTIRRYAQYIRIADGNLGNGEGAEHNKTPDYEFKNPDDPRCVNFRNRALASRYAQQWREAFRQIRNKCDGSDAVEVAWILGIPTNSIPTLSRFADRYF